MFKILALVAAIAGGTTYGLYAHTDLFNGKCGGAGCPLSISADTQPAQVSTGEAKPSCCEQSAPCCEDEIPCCASKATKAVAVKAVSPCCASQTIPVSAANARHRRPGGCGRGHGEEVMRFTAMGRSPR